MAAVEVRVLGPVDVVGEEGPIELARKPARLLAALVVADGRACGVDELAEAMWSDSAPSSARKLVRVYVSQLRKVLPAGIEIATQQGAYAVSLSSDALDAARFERLLRESVQALRAENAALALSLADRALSLWRGRAYGELGDEEFARGESERLEELRLAAMDERLDAIIALGGHAEALGDVLAYAAENPLRERAHELAMLALYRCGRQADALEHFTAVRTQLRDELGLDPGPALRALQRRILEQDSELAAAAGAAPEPAALPVPATLLLGREREMDELGALLSRRESRLIVLTGAGGSGKTRLALEVARRTAGSFANGTTLVELAPLRDPALVVPTIARALEVALDADEDALDAIALALGSRELLLVLDNAEHLRTAAQVYPRLVARAPRLTVLVTSRAVLHVSGEHVFPVAPLEEEAAMSLFAQRACLLDPSFELTEANEPDVREICRRVDGLPLAIELAAARTRTLSPSALRARLDARLALLTGGPQDLPARQRTLRETIDWSVELLTEQQRNVFARLAAFPSGATLSAVEEVCGGDVDSLGALVDNHLVRRADVDDEPRFRMLETIREYALELLARRRPAVEAAMARHLTDLVERAELKGPAAAQWMLRLDAELDNLRAALDAALRAAPDVELRLAGGLWRYWWVRGLLGEGIGRIEAALEHDIGPPSAARAHALRGAAGLAWSSRDHAYARKLALEAITVASAVDATAEEMAAHTVLGVVASTDVDYVAARHHFGRSIELAEAAGLPDEVVTGKMNLGDAALNSGEVEEAARLFAEGLEYRRRTGSLDGIGFALLNLGQAQLRLGSIEAARVSLVEAYESFAAVGFRARMAHTQQALAEVEATDGNPEEAVILLGRARAALDELGWTDESTLPSRLESELRRTLGDERFEAAYAAGRDRTQGTS